MECTFCKTKLQGKFCHECGQLHTGKPITIQTNLLDLANNIFSLEAPFVKTTLKLIVNPVYIVKNFWDGNRKLYLSPAKMLVYAMLIVALFLNFFTQPHRIFGLVFDLEGTAPQILFVLILLPFFILSSITVYINQNANIAKHISSVTYAFSVVTIFLALFETFLRQWKWLFENLEPSLPLLLVILINLQQARVFAHNRTTIIKCGYAVLQMATIFVFGFCFLHVLKFFQPNWVSF